MNITHRAISAYRIKMQDCINTWKGEERNCITQEDLAACMQVKVNQSFRRHISELQTDGLVTRFTYVTEKGGHKVAYLINT